MNEERLSMSAEELKEFVAAMELVRQANKDVPTPRATFFGQKALWTKTKALLIRTDRRSTASA
jgi:hypothetical protein